MQRGKLGTEVEFVGVTASTDHAAIDDIIDSWFLEFPTIVDGADLWEEHEVFSHPVTLYVSADGTIDRVLGGQSPQTVKSTVEALVAAA